MCVCACVCVCVCDFCWRGKTCLRELSRILIHILCTMCIYVLLHVHVCTDCDDGGGHCYGVMSDVWFTLTHLVTVFIGTWQLATFLCTSIPLGKWKQRLLTLDCHGSSAFIP